MVAPGCVVAWFREGEIALGVVAAIDGERARIVGTGGKEERVPLGRIVVTIESGPAPGATRDDRVAAGRRAAAAAQQVALRGSQVDVASLWEVAHESAEALDLAAWSALALGDDDPLARAGTAFALARDTMHFVRRADGWDARAADAVAEIGLQRRREAERAAERDGALAALRVAASGGGFEPTGSATERRVLDALEHLAVFDDATDDARRALAEETLDAVGAKGDRPAERAFRLLRGVGRFGSDHENLAIRRYALRTEFTSEVLAAAHEAARSGPAGARTDLTALPVFTIDGTHTREIDDALSIERRPSGSLRVGVHIADPAAFLVLGGVLDEEAIARTTTHYFPDLRLPMIPEILSEQAASLVAGEARPALSFFAEVGEDGELVAELPARSTIRSTARLDYDGADLEIRDGGPHAEALRDLLELADRLRARRARDGAILLEADEVEARVGPGGEVRLERFDPRSPSRRLVSEAMVLTGAIAARFCIERSIPAIYRRQPPPFALPAGSSVAGDDPVAVRALRRSLRRGEVGVEPGAHFALGLPAYAQASSPLRRFQDLVMHRQIIAALEGRPPDYDLEAIRKVAGITERAESEGRRAERAADAYWLLRYLEASAAREVDAVVVDLHPTVVQLVETLVEARVPGLTGVAAGDRVRLRVERVNPRADLLVLRSA